MDDITSLMITRAASVNKGITLTATDVCRPTGLGLSYVKLNRLGISGLLAYLKIPESRPLGIVVPKRKDRIRAHGIHCSVDSMQRDGAPFLLLSSADNKNPSPLVSSTTNVCVQHPARIVLGMARRIRRKELNGELSGQQAILLLVKLCLELCGTYSHDPFDPNHADATYNTEQWLTCKDLRNYLQANGNEQGLSLARLAASLSYDKSGSPQESFMGPALFYSSRLGGLDLGNFIANEPLNLTNGERASINFRIITPDFQLPDYNSVVEYLGEIHKEGNNPDIDHTRTLDYQTLGKREFAFWYSDVDTQAHFLKSAARIVNAIAQVDGPEIRESFRRRISRPGFKERQKVLFSVFRPWLRGK